MKEGTKFYIMKKLNIYFIAVSIALEATSASTVNAQTIEFELQTEDSVDYEKQFDQILSYNSKIVFPEINQLLADDSWQKNGKCIYSQNPLYQENTNPILWDEVLIKIKENNEIYLKEHPELDYLTVFKEEELQEILNNQEAFMNIMYEDYGVDLRNIASNLEELEILKDTREPITDVPYFANYEPSTQTMTFLEDWDLEYYKISQAHEETHLIQSANLDSSSTKLKQSVWEEPIEYSMRQKPSPLRTITLDEYIAYIQSQKINLDYPIDIPEYDLIYLLELSFLPNPDYKFQDTLTSLSLSQNQEGFYQLFGNKMREKNKVHKLMHMIDLCYGFFSDERETINLQTEELMEASLLEINRNLFENLIQNETVYSKEMLFYLIKLNKQYSLYILDSYMLEESEIYQESIRSSYLNNYEQLETIAFKELEKKYQIPELSKEYQEYSIPSDMKEMNPKNQELLNQITLTVQEFYDYHKEKALTLSQSD